MRCEVTGIDDYFAVFGLPRKLTVDGEALRARFYELSRAHHPDFHQGADADAQAETLARSALVNRAYRALRDPLARVEYLIALEEGRDTREGATARAGRAPGAPGRDDGRAGGARGSQGGRAWTRRRAPGSARSGSACGRGSARRKTPSWAGRRTGTPRWARAPTAGRCSSGSRRGWPRGRILRTVIDDLSEALGEDLESHVSHRRH